MKIISIVLILALAVSCKTKKETSDAVDSGKMTEKSFAISTCYTQKEIPGEEHITPNHYLMIQLNNIEYPVKLDSIKYAEKTYPLRQIRLQYKAKIDASATAKSATLYYTEEGKAYFSNIDKIEVKEEIYLPSAGPGEDD